ncbi:MAG TPA: TRAP transporter small permease [Burkholderiales bacterium]|jgi:TRAP-type C4-dicarboxylate transport system permease small subunit|nr:TRAP transporter small permease [Burkholderiales bacterium]
MSRFDRAIVPALGTVAAALMFCLMLLTCVDVVGRYFFNKPVTGGFELTEMLLAALIFAGLPLVTLRGDHITVDLFDPVTPDWLFHIQHALATLIGAACTGYLAWCLWLRATALDRAGETTSQLQFKIAWLAYAMAMLMALTAAALVVTLFRPPHRHIPGQGEGPGA